LGRSPFPGDLLFLLFLARTPRLKMPEPAEVETKEVEMYLSELSLRAYHSKKEVNG
jgi:hypothetical protein